MYKNEQRNKTTMKVIKKYKKYNGDLYRKQPLLKARK